MRSIQSILLEPVGCLAEFPSAPFHEAAVRLFDRKGKASRSGSRSYWHLLNLMEGAAQPLAQEQRDLLQGFEAEAVEAATIYEDVQPALAELRSMGIRLSIATS